ncbi:MAG: response regulator transcription factor [Porticoccaceae bacterium]|nr:response regulator transcription factor [Porticoccaceae bacterium]
MAEILIIDDDEELSEMLCEYLRPEGFSISTAQRGDEGVDKALKQTWDAIVLDIMLPGMNGIEVLRTIRRHSLVPIIMLTAKGGDVDRILGLEMGADDYLPKPFNPRELVARLRAILRRQGNNSGNTAAIYCQSLIMMPAARKASVGAYELNLTSTEYSVLEVLARHAGQLVSKEQLYEAALGRAIGPYDRSLDMHISHLRKKLGDADENLIIHTIRGSGYQLEK